MITGIGAISSLGLDASSIWQGLIGGKSGIDYISSFNAETFPCKVAAEANDFDPNERIKNKQFLEIMSRPSQFMLSAVEMAMEDSQLDGASIVPERCGVCVGTALNFPVDFTAEMFEHRYTFKNNGVMDLQRYASQGQHDPSMYYRRNVTMVSGIPAIIYDFAAQNLTIDTACASSAQAIGEAFRMIQHGETDIMIAGGVDTLVNFVVITGFSVLGALSQNDDPKKASRPFDSKRDGFVVGEGSGALILEELSSALARRARIYAEVLGYGSSLSAYRITDVPADGKPLAICMEKALDDAGLKACDIDYINAHGTSTPQNDRGETAAIKRVFGERAYQIPISANKSQLGHVISGAGALELISSVFTIQEDIIPPTINYEHFDPACDLDYTPNNARKKNVDIALSNSFGFGGQNATLIVGKYKD